MCREKFTFTLTAFLVKQRYRVTLDLNMPSFHRSASEPSVVCATYMRKKDERGKKKHAGGGIKLMYVCHEHVVFASSPHSSLN